MEGNARGKCQRETLKCQAGENGIKLKLLGEGNLNPSYSCQFDVLGVQRLERHCRTAGEHPKSSTKEFQPVQTANLFMGSQTEMPLCKQTQQTEQNLELETDDYDLTSST